MRRLAAALLLLTVLSACSGRPSSLVDPAGYQVDGDKVYYLSDFPGTAFQIPGADAGSFHSYDRRFAGDRANVYFEGRRIVGADPASFVLLADREGWAKDRGHVYHHDRPVSSDPAHFVVLEGGLAKDSTAVYWSDGAVVSDDPAHFAVVSNDDHYLFTKDAHAVEVNGALIADADPATFRVLFGGYARDRQAIFYFTDRVADADPASFQTLAGSYARDARHAYWMGAAIPGVDLTSFRVLNANLECSADAAHAYYRDSIVAGADPRTFPQGRAVTECSERSITFAH
ncbi:hypothetical protein ABIA30_003021 [Mycobacterium sp. MAA66]|uniref:DKNYY domain-containing protein n=1 Tax=Mycobacterium sp. MAA66 TaxID=3156297 RepID=UPI0035197F15